MTDKPDETNAQTVEQTPPDGGVSDSGAASPRQSAPSAGQVAKAKAGDPNYINFEELDPEVRSKIEPRFRSVYKDMKGLENALKQLQKHNGDLEERLSAFLTTQEKRDNTQRVDNLKTQARKAYEEGRYEDAEKLLDDMSKQTEKIVDKAEKRSGPAAAASDSGFSADDILDIRDWQGQTDDDGRVLRPWAQPSSPQHKVVASLADAVMQDPEFADRPMKDILKEVDRLMAARLKKAQTAPVMSNDVTPGRVNGKNSVKLTEAQKAVAMKMFRGDKDPIGRYTRQLQKIG